MINKFYPSIATLIKSEDFPQNLSFLQDITDDILQGAFYKDLQIATSSNGDSTSYNFKLLCYRRIEKDILDTGLKFIFNASEIPDNGSEFLLYFSYHLGILKYLQSFNIEKFDWSSKAIFNLFIEITGESRLSILQETIQVFIQDKSEFNEKINSFIDKYNLNHPQKPLIVNPDENIETYLQNILNSFEQLEVDVYEIIFNLYIFNTNSVTFWEQLRTLFTKFIGFFNIDILKELITPKIQIGIDNINLALEFPRNWLKPIDPTTGKINPDETVKSRLRFTVGSLKYSTEGGIEFENESSFDFTKSEIGNTGLSFMFYNMKLDLSRTRNIPEAETAGYPTDFIGVYVEQAEIDLPKKWFKQESGATLAIYGEKMLIGTGGISGTIALRAIGGEEAPSGSVLTKRIGDENGFEIGFRQFDLTLQQNMFVESNINGYICVPWLMDTNNQPAQLDMSVGITQTGDWHFTVSETDGIPLSIAKVLDIDLKSLSIGQDNGHFYANLACKLSFNPQNKQIADMIAGFEVEINQLRIWHDGRIDLDVDCGSLTLKKPIKIRLGSKAEFAITALHIGTEKINDRQYMFLGMDCALSTGTGGVDAKGNGLKVYFTIDNGNFDCFFRLQGINIDLTLPGGNPDKAEVILNGYLQLNEEQGNNTGESEKTGGPEYIGGVTLTLPRLNFGVSANMRLMPKYPAFLVDIDLDLPICIPLGPTGAGIYGFRGLTGLHYTASKKAAGLQDSDGWWQYYKAKIAPDYKEGIQVSKFELDKEGFALGAGISLATAFDSGYVFSSKLFMMLSMPDVFLLQGQAAILKERIGLNTENDPPFFAMVAISRDSIEAAFGVDMFLPDSGSAKGAIAEIHGLNEMAFYWGDAGAWHFYIGRETPEEKRVRAKVLKIFNAYMYLMIDKGGIKTGAGAGFDFGLYLDKKQQVGFEANAYIDLEGHISFKPLQLGGGIRLGGGACIKIFSFKLGFSVGAALSAEAPAPYHVMGEFSLKLELPWPIRKLGGPYTIRLEWGSKTAPDTEPIALFNSQWAKAVNMQTGDLIELSKDTSQTIPVDSFIDIEFTKGVNCTLEHIGAIAEGAEYIDLVPPQPTPSGQVQHEFSVTNIDISIKNSAGQWIAYDPYEALKPQNSEGPSDKAAKMIWGYWQCITPHVHNKLRLFARSPLSYLNSGPYNLIPEDLGYEEGFLLCRGTKRDRKQIRFNMSPTHYMQGKQTCYAGVLFLMKDTDGDITTYTRVFDQPDLGIKETIDKSLAGTGTLIIRLPEPCKEIVLYLRMDAVGGTITCYENGEKNPIIYTKDQISSNGILMIKSERDISRFEIYTPPATTDSLICAEQGKSILAMENNGGLLTETSKPRHGETLLYGIDLLSNKDYTYNQSIPAKETLENNVQEMISGFTEIPQPTWRPDSEYRITVKACDKVTYQGNTVSNEQEKQIFFNTQKAVIGFNQTQNLKLQSLQHYIDFEHSYPYADSKLINAKPWYYHDGNEKNITLVFQNDYTEQMFNNYSSYAGNPEISYTLSAKIREASDMATQEEFSPTEWNRESYGKATAELNTINNLAGSPCPIDRKECECISTMEPQQSAMVIKPEGLKPKSMYMASFYVTRSGSSAGQPITANVHQYIFQTSRYASFSEHIESFDTGNEKSLFKVEGNYSNNQLTAMLSLLNNTQSDFSTSDKIDCLLYEILEIPALPAPIGTEVNIIKNGTTVIGLLVCSPEPFNIPRIEDNLLKDTVILKINDSKTENILAYSLDRTRIFVSTPNLQIQKGTAKLTFKYLFPTKNEYKSIEEKTITFNI